VAPFQPPGQTGAYGRPTPAGPPGAGAAQPQLRPRPQPRSRKPLPRPVSAAMVLVGAGLVAWAVWSLTR
ncbi:serine/threonine protein kinase, partial [Streptomyces sp. ActVer]|nr:serine/threonine protein kinase [Streptomyces sp. ActVer]